MSTELMSDEQINDIWNALEKSGADMIGGITALVRRRVEFARAIAAHALAANRSQHPACGYCDGTGDVHSIDGEWRGRCSCIVGSAMAALAACDRIIDQDNGILGGIDFHALGKSLRTSLASATASPEPHRSQHPSPAPADERAAFEAWAKLKNLSLIRCGAMYLSLLTDASWVAWHARASLASPAAAPTEAQFLAWAERECTPLPPWWDDFISNVCEIPDRNSPEDEPEAMIATAQELEFCALCAIEAHSALATTRLAQEPPDIGFSSMYGLATPIPVAAPAGGVSGSVALAAWEETFDKNESINDAWQRVADRVVAAIPSGEGQASAVWAEWWAKNRRDEACSDALEDLTRAAYEFGRAGEGQAVDALRTAAQNLLDNFKTKKTNYGYTVEIIVDGDDFDSLRAALSPPQTGDHHG